MNRSGTKPTKLIPRTHIIASLEEGRPKEILAATRNLVSHVDGFLFRLPMLLSESLNIIHQTGTLIRRLGENMPLIADTRLDPPARPHSIRSMSTLIENQGGYGMTVFAINAPSSFIGTCSRYSKVMIFPIIDLGEDYVRANFPDRFVVALARTSSRYGCAGVIMSARNSARIRKVRNAQIENLPILAYMEPGTSKGSGLSSGADFEIAREF